MMRSYRGILAALLGLGLFVAGTGSAQAHSGTPVKSFHVHAGPYPLTVNYYSTPRAGQALSFNVVPDPGVGGPIRYQATAVPGATVDAVPVQATLAADPGNPTGIGGTVNLPITGQWLLTLDVDGPLGRGAADAPILAGAPPAIPVWAGWLVGLLPVWAMLGFLGVQAWRAGRAGPVPAPARA